jgi:hypothetical protein
VIAVQCRADHRLTHSKSPESGDAPHHKAWQGGFADRFGWQSPVIGAPEPLAGNVAEEVAQLFSRSASARPPVTTVVGSDSHPRSASARSRRSAWVRPRPASGMTMPAHSPSARGISQASRAHNHRRGQLRHTAFAWSSMAIVQRSGSSTHAPTTASSDETSASDPVIALPSDWPSYRRDMPTRSVAATSPHGASRPSRAAATRRYRFALIESRLVSFCPSLFM